MDLVLSASSTLANIKSKTDIFEKKGIKCANCARNHTANYSMCLNAPSPPPKKNPKVNRITNIKDASNVLNSKKVTADAFFASVEKGVHKSQINSIDLTSKFNFTDINKNDIDSFIVQVQLVANLLERIHNLITKLGLAAKDVLSMSAN